MKVPRHYSFGENWKQFIGLVNQSQIDSAVKNLKIFLKGLDLTKIKVLDLGSGSGIHALAFLNLGVTNLTCIDYDVVSVETTDRLLSQSQRVGHLRIARGDILDLKTLPDEKYDLVYSWGVLHHTGNLKLAIRNATLLVESNGFLAIAVYRKTPMCRFWKIEKRIYANASPFVKKLFEYLYVAMYMSIEKTRNPSFNRVEFIDAYKANRGMDFYTDVRDWLGGFPYESISADNLCHQVQERGFEMLYSNISKSGFGLRGTGCDEFLFKRIK